MIQNVRRYVVSIAVIAMVAMACSPDGAVPGTDGGSDTLPDGSASGGTLRVAAFEPVGQLDPHDYLGNMIVQSLVFDPLLVYAEGGALEPGLAESWETSDDGLTYTFTLREGVSFHDGEPFNAAAAVANFERWLALESHSWLGSWHVIDSVEAADEMTLQVNLSEPYASFLHEMSFTRPPRFASPDALEVGGTIDPVGTGAWVLESNRDDGGVVLSANPDYWAGAPRIDRVEFVVIPDSQIRVAAIQSGEVDVVGGEYLAALAPEEIQVLEDSEDVTMLLESGTTNLLLAFNAQADPLADPEVRRAINLAIDKQAIASSLFRGYAEPASAVYPESVPYAEAGEQEGFPFDPAEAKAVLEAAGWSGEPVRSRDGEQLSFELVMDEAQFPQARALSEALRSQLNEVGIEVDIRALDSAGYTQAIVVDRSYDLAFFITFGTPFDPAMSLTTLFQSSASTDDGKVFTSPELDPLITQALAASGDADRAEAFGAIWQFFDENAATAPLVEQQRAWAIGSRVTEHELGVTEYDLPLHRWAVSG